MHFKSSKVALALAEIKQRNMNRFRCVLTGAPFATIDDSEIEHALDADELDNPQITHARLIDQWEWRLLTYSTHRAPVFRNVKPTALIPMLQAGPTGHARIATYMLLRLLFPQHESIRITAESEKARAAFAREAYDNLVERDAETLLQMSQKLVAIDAYCAMPLWHELWAFKSIHSTYPTHYAHAEVKNAFQEPETVLENAKGIDRLITFMFELMLYVTERDGVAGKGGSRLAKAILLHQEQRAPKLTIPHFQKTISEADVLRIKQREALNKDNRLRVAYSAIHGKGHLPQTRDSALDVAATARSLLAEMKAKKENKKDKPRVAKEAKPVDPKKKALSDAFASSIANIDWKL